MLRAETENVRAAREGAKNMMRQALPRSQRGALITPSEGKNVKKKVFEKQIGFL